MDIASFYDSPQQIQLLANIGHNVPGYALCIIAVLFILAELGYKRKLLATAYSLALIAMPVVFVAFVFLSNGLFRAGALVSIMSQYPEVYLHIFTLAGNTFGGIGEILYVRGKLKFPLGALYFPVLFLVDGYLSILHPHSGGHHDIFHNVYGSLMVAAGLLIILERLITDEFRKYFIALAGIAIAVPGMMLIGYSEPLSSFASAFPVSNTATSTAVTVAGAETAVVYLSNTGAVPHEIRIHVGQSVTFIKLDDSIHDMASGPHPQHNNYPPLNIGVLLSGEKKTVMFAKAGFFGYHDHFNDEDARFKGSVTVVP